MKRLVTLLTALALPIALAAPAGAVDFQEELQQLTQDNARGYIGPFATAFGTAMNSGLYHTAKPHSLLGFDVSLKASLLQVAEEDLTFEYMFPHLPIPIDPLYGVPNNTITVDLNQFYPDRVRPTVFGDSKPDSIRPVTSGVDAVLEQSLRDAGMDPAAISTLMQTAEWDTMLNTISGNLSPIPSPAGIGLDFFPWAMPQVSVGLPMKTEVLIRLLPATETIPEIGTVSFTGIGVKHNVSQYIPVPMFPVDISAQFVWQQLKIGDIVKSTHTNFNVEASKRLGLPGLSFTPYVGLGFESSNIDISYTVEGSDEPDFNHDGVGDLEGQTISFNLDGDNSFRATGGLRLGLGFFTVNADYSAGAYNSASVGVGLTLR
jgi:hypothetical protein